MKNTPSSSLEKLLHTRGYGSRKETVRMVRDGAVSYQGEAITTLPKEYNENELLVLGEALEPAFPLVAALHKPTGFTCSNKESGKLIWELLPERWKARVPEVQSVGRLDKDTSGLLLLTDDGQLLHRLTSPKRNCEKIYRVKLARPVEDSYAAALAEGTLMLEGETKPICSSKLAIIDPYTVRLTVTEGRYHMVRRMFAALGNHVDQLHRESFADLTLKGIDEGAWRILTADEVSQLQSK